MHQRKRPILPTRWLFTDERIADERLLRAVSRLRRGSGIVFRHYTLPCDGRRALFGRVRRIARRRGLVLHLAAASARMAVAWGADGVHVHPSTRPARSHLLSCSAHNIRELRSAERSAADVVFLSPLFATRSHPVARPLGAVRFAAIARRAVMPVMALGGVHPRHARLVRRLGASGFGAIDSLSR